MSKHKKKIQIESKLSYKRNFILFVIACVITTSVIVVLKKEPVIISQLTKQTTQGSSSKISEVQYADPFITIKRLIEGNKEKILLVDMRSPQDYNVRHFKNTVNVYFPYESDREGERDFVKVIEKKASQFKKVVLLPYSSASTTGEEAAYLLMEERMDNVWVMKIGWNELYSLPGMWIPEDQADKFTLSTILDN